MKKTVLLHIDSLCVLDEMTDVQAGQLFKAIKDHLLGVEPTLEFGVKMAFIPFRNQFLRDAEAYQKTVERNRINGLKGGRPSETEHKAEEPNKSEWVISQPKKADKDKDKDKDNKTDISIEVKNIPKTTFSEANVFKPIFLEKFKSIHNEDYYWTAKDAGQCKKIASKLIFKMKEKVLAKKMPEPENYNDRLGEAFKILLDMIPDGWLKENMSMANVNSHFNAIIANKNGKSPTKQHEAINSILNYSADNGH